MSRIYLTTVLRPRQAAPRIDDPADLFRRVVRATRDREFGRAKELMAELRRHGWSVCYLGDARERRR